MRTTNKQNTPYYFVAAGIFILLKFWFSSAATGDLIFLLKPTDKLVGLFTGSHSVFLDGKGFYHESLNIFIDKSCSGFNFLVLCFLVFTYLALNYFGKPLHKILTLPAVLLFAYLFSIFVTASRIFASIAVQRQTADLFPRQQHLIHESVGIITYLTFLVFTYFLLEKLLKAKHSATHTTTHSPTHTTTTSNER